MKIAATRCLVSGAARDLAGRAETGAAAGAVKREASRFQSRLRLIRAAVGLFNLREVKTRTGLDVILSANGQYGGQDGLDAGSYETGESKSVLLSF